MNGLGLSLLLVVAGCSATREASLPDFAAPAADLGPPGPCYALHFDGIAGRADSPALPDPPASFTLEAWIRAESVPGGFGAVLALISRGDPYNHYDGESLELEQDGRAAFQLYGGGRDVIPSSNLGAVSTAWMHMAGVFDSASETISFFLNGQLQASGPTRASGFPLNMAPLIIAGERTATPGVFQGYIAEVRLSATARYTQDFRPAAHLDADSETVALYHLDETSGAVAHDVSMNHADATLSGGATFAVTTCR